MTEKELKTLKDTIEKCLPKTYKFKYVLKPEQIEALKKDGFDLEQLDTIRMPGLVDAALKSTFKEFDPSLLIKKAKEPTDLSEDVKEGVVISKKMVTKTGKILKSVGISLYEFEGNGYVCFRLDYDLFYIIEIFIYTLPVT